MEAGLNLYSIRGLLADEPAFLDTCTKLKEMGYSYLQFSGATYDPQMICRIWQQTGLPFVLTHVPMDRILHDTKALMQEHRLFGCRNIGLGMMPIRDEAETIDIMAQLNEAGRIMAEEGYTFFYHFHHYEFRKLSSGQRIIDYMIENCPYIHFTADTYWMQYGGVDVCEYLEKMQGRIGCVHVKDYRIDRNSDGNMVPCFAPVGEGNMNFPVIVETAKRCGAQYFLVEQDDATDYDDPLEQVGMSIRYIQNKL